MWQTIRLLHSDERWHSADSPLDSPYPSPRTGLTVLDYWCFFVQYWFSILKLRYWDSTDYSTGASLNYWLSVLKYCKTFVQYWFSTDPVLWTGVIHRRVLHKECVYKVHSCAWTIQISHWSKIDKNNCQILEIDIWSFSDQLKVNQMEISRDLQFWILSKILSKVLGKYICM